MRLCLQDKTSRILSTFVGDLASGLIEEARQVVEIDDSRLDIKRYVDEAVHIWDEVFRCGGANNRDRLTGALLKRKLTMIDTLDNGVKYKPVLLHADISREHIFVDDEEGALRGIIDWFNAVVGDTHRDIAGQSLSVGREVAGREELAIRFSAHTVGRGQLFAMCLTVRNLRHLLDGCNDSLAELVKSQFKRAVETTGTGGALTWLN